MRFLVRAQIPTEIGKKSKISTRTCAKVEFHPHPVMVFEDLKKAIEHLS